MDLNNNQNQNINSLQQVLNSSNFAQFLSEHLSNSNISESQISNLLNIYSNQLNNQNRQNNNINENSQLGEPPLNQSQIGNYNNNSIISNSNILSDIDETPIINNCAAPEIINFSKKEYENGTYEGSLIGNKREGQGIMKYKSGDIYEGEYKKDKKHGKGIYISADGYKYEGEFFEGLREGKGKIV